MKKWIFAALMMASLTAGAQDEVGSQKGEQGLDYREGDPFLFCKEGLKRPRAWAPLDPAHGIHIVELGYCPIEHDGGTCPMCIHEEGVHFTHWSHDDYEALQQFRRICPIAIETGRWDGENGSYKTSRPVDR